MNASRSPDVRRSPLHEVHAAAGASFTEFAGWWMPVRYSSELAEHHAVRTAAGIFDISHMAEFAVQGPDAPAYLDYALAGRLSTIEPGRAKYSLLLTEAGGILDDLVVYVRSQNEFLVVANASNREPVHAELLARAAGFEVTITDETERLALIAVQGPGALEVLQNTRGLIAEHVAELKYYRHLAASFDGVPALVARTGYTGEDGFELYLEADAAVALWVALTAAGGPLGLVPAGLASRDTLRLEAGMPLYGNELGRDILPQQAGLGRVVDLTKDAFVGKEALEAGPADGARVLVGLASEGRRAGRAGYAVYSATGQVGEITSGALSPTLGHPIALAYVDPGFSEVGTELSIDLRGTPVAASVVALPFYKREK